MLCRWDRGWGGPVLLVCFILFPVLALVFRRKWRFAEARRVEIIRLLRVAAAEAERAEREAAVFAFALDPPASVVIGGGTGMSNCSVCHSPTTTRCARCKVFKYCSGKCQIIHWRKGHKDACHPPPVDHVKSRVHVADFRGGQPEWSEISDNWSEIEAHNWRNDVHYNAYPNISSMVAGQAEEIIFSDSRSKIERKLDDVKTFDASFNESMPSMSDLPSETYSQIVNIRQKPSVTTSGKELFATSLIHSSASTNSTFLGSGGMSEVASSTEGHTGAEPGQHSNGSYSYVSFANQPNPEKFSSSVTLESSRTSVGSEKPKFINEETECKPKFMNVEAECKLNGPSNIKSSSSTRSLNVQFCQNNNDSRTAGLSFKILDKFENSKFSENDNECQEAAVEIVRSADCTEFHTPCNSNQTQLDAKLHSNGSVKVSTPKSFSPRAGPVRLKPTGAKDLRFEKSCSVAYREKNKDQFMSLSSSLDDQNSLLAQSLTILKKIPGVENNPPVSSKSLEISNSLLISKVLVEGVKQISSSSLRLVQPGVCNYGSLKYDYKMLFSYDLFIKLYNSDKVGLNPFGLVNCGNSCYVNAALQCLAFTRPLAAYLLEGLHAKTCSKKEWCFTCALESLLMMANHGKSPLSPVGIISHIDVIGSSFSQGREEDAHEFLRCKSYEQAKKQLTILEAPNVLTIALKRYQSGKFGKLNKMVRFPEYLNLAPYMGGSDDKSPVYRLYAVVVHNDVMNAVFSGHYVCYVKNALGKWFIVDDSVVKQVELQAVLSQGAYMLLYARCSPRAPSLLRKEIANSRRLKQNGDSHNPNSRSSSKFSHPGLAVTHQGKTHASHSYDPKFGLYDLFEEKLHRSKLDISSDSSSLFSCSDEGSSSWSADSTKDSATTEDFTESVNGEAGHMMYCNSPLRFSEDSDGFICSPNSPDLSPLDSRMVMGIGSGGEGGLQGTENRSFLYSTKQCRNLTKQRSSRQTNWVSSSEVKPSVLLKRFSGDKTAQTFS